MKYFDIYAQCLTEYDAVGAFVGTGCGCRRKVDPSEEAGGDAFIEDEKKLAAAMAAAIMLVAKSESPKILKAIADSAGDPDVVADQIDRSSALFREAVPDGGAADKKIKRTLSDTLAVGAALVLLGDTLTTSLARADVLAGLSKSAVIYTNAYFDRIVTPRLLAPLSRADVIGNGTAMRDAVLHVLDGTVNTVDPYWRLVANTNVSRSHHYGILKAGQQVGYRGYRLVVVDDDRTSEICRALIGREFWISDGISHLERIAQADVEDQKSMAPWVRSSSEIAGRSSAELARMGVLLPPFHGWCRTTIQPIL